MQRWETEAGALSAMNLVNRPSMSTAISILVIAVGLIGACTTEHRDVGGRDIKFDTPAMQTLGVMRIYRNDAHVGWLEKTRLIDGDDNDANDTYQHFVRDLNRGKVGFITEDMLAYRYRAHYAPERVANHPDMAIDIMAIFGWADGQIRLEPEVAKE